MASTLSQYLQAVRQQEENRITCSLLLDKLKEKRQQAELRLISMPTPALPSKKEPKYSKFPEREPRLPRRPKVGGIFGIGTGPAVGIWAVLFAVLACIDLAKGKEEIGMGAVMIPICIALPLGWACGAIIYFKRRSRYTEALNRYNFLHEDWVRRKAEHEIENERIQKEQCEEEYRQAMEAYNTKLSSNEFVCNELNKDIAQSKLVESTVQAQIDNINSTLNKLYDTEIIYPKYRDLVSVTMFCEYIDSGRCSQLEGSNGAYNLYESEKRADLIIARMDEVVSSLDTIRQNQFYLYQSINNVHATVNRLAGDIYDMAKIQAYQSKLLTSSVDALSSIELANLEEMHALRKSIKD